MKIARTRSFSALITLIVLALALVGCGTPSAQSQGENTVVTEQSTQQSASTQEAQKPANITMWSFLDPNGTSGREVALKQIIEKFEADNSHIKVEVQPQAWDTLSAKFFTASQSGDAPDISWVDFEDLSGALELDALEPLENLFLKNWSEDEIKDINDAYFHYGESEDGKHYQITFSRNYVGIIYRADILAEMGYDTPLKDWDEFYKIAKDSTVDKDPVTGIKRYGFGSSMTLESADPWFMSSMLLKQYGKLFNEDGSANWANDTSLNAINLLKDMMDNGIMNKDNLINVPDDVYSDFAAGMYTMMSGVTTRIANIKANCVFDAKDVQFMPFPSYTEGEISSSNIGGWCVGIWSGSKNKEAAGKFLEAMISPESDKLWVEVAGQVPIRQSTAQTCADYLADPNNKYLVDAADAIVKSATPSTDYVTVGWKVDQKQVVQDVLVNGKDPMEALQSAEKAFNDRNVE